MLENAISQVAEKGAVSGWVLIKRVFLKTAINGAPYAQWDGLDITGTSVKGSVFGGITPNEIPPVKPGQVWHVEGIMEMSRGGLQVYNSTMTLIEIPAEIQMFKSRCLPTLPVEQYNLLLGDLRTYADSITDPALRQLSDTFWRYWLPYLPFTPAGHSVHEAYRGGLLRHTWDVLKIVDSPAVWKHNLNRDVLLFCALYHDIGKVRAYTDEMEMTFEGKLVPHTFIALELLTLAITGCNITITPKLLMQIKHCFITHHGEYSEIEPRTREAQVLHRADMVASGLGHFAELTKGSIGTDGWGSYDQVLKGYPYLPEKDLL